MHWLAHISLTDATCMCAEIRIHFFIYLDVDVCADGSHNCEHVCQNTNGSYTCSCLAGYELSDNGFACDST